MMNEASDRFSFPSNILGTLKFGPGVIGRTAIPITVFLAVGGLIAWAVHGVLWATLLVFFTLALVVLLYLIFSFWFAHKHPNHAVMESGTLVRYTEIMQGAGDPNIIEGSPQPIANTSPPPALSEGD
jgi:hypothetical protein